jgi:hypothetical protein
MKEVTMYFHLAGVVSEEVLPVHEETEKTISLKDDDTIWQFDKKTGKCLNDNTAFGAKRTIKPITVK